jgi:hypothetical protein
MTAVLLTLGAVVGALVTVLVVGTARAGRPSAPRPPREDGEPTARAGRVALEVEGTSPDGAPVKVPIAGPTMLAFLTTTCTTCDALWATLADPRRRRLPGSPRLVVVTKGDEAESRERVRRLAPGGLPVVMSSAGWHAYGISTAPHFVFVDGASRTVLGAGPASTWSDVVALCTAPARAS